MPTRALVFPFTCTDTTLPVQNMTPGVTVTPVANAKVDYSAAPLTDGALTSWPSQIASSPALTGTATVVTEGGKKHVNLNGVSNFLDAAMTHTQPETVAIRFRLPTPAASETIIGASASGSVTIAVVPQNTNYQVYAGSALLLAPAAVPDSNWHTLIVVTNGANSIISLDGVETVGQAGAATRNGLRLGRGPAASTTYNDIDVRRIAVVTQALDATARGVLKAQMDAA